MHKIKTNTMIRQCTVLLVVSLVLCFSGSAIAQDHGDDNRSYDPAQANNPLADFTAFNLHNYYIPQLSGPTDTTANNFILRYAKPFGKWLMRASLPFSRVPVGMSETQSGMGDLDVFFAYLFDTGDPGKSFGVGPQIVFDTATDDATGSGKYQAGLAAVYFDSTSPAFQWGDYRLIGPTRSLSIND